MPDIHASAPWTGRPIRCWFDEESLVCLAGDVGKNVPLVVRGDGAVEVAAKLKRLGYGRVKLQ